MRGDLRHTTKKQFRNQRKKTAKKAKKAETAKFQHNTGKFLVKFD